MILGEGLFCALFSNLGARESECPVSETQLLFLVQWGGVAEFPLLFTSLPYSLPWGERFYVEDTDKSL